MDASTIVGASEKAVVNAGRAVVVSMSKGCVCDRRYLLYVSLGLKKRLLWVDSLMCEGGAIAWAYRRPKVRGEGGDRVSAMQ